MITFHKKYHPLTSRPLLKSNAYTEYVPCEALRPYVACFWGPEAGIGQEAGQGVGPDTDAPSGRDTGAPSGRDTGAPSGRDMGALSSRVLVVPDTCVDIIIEINHTRQRIKSRLCGLQDYSVTVEQKTGGEAVTSFAVRFYFWSVRLFFHLNLRELYNRTMDLDLLLPGCDAEFEAILYLKTVGERIAWMEAYLLGRLEQDRANPKLYNAIDCLLRAKGSGTVREICEYSCVSQRQMERIFLQEVGLTIKRTASLVRYQNVWRDIVQQECFDIQDAVYRYGYADQAHLLHEFKRFHSVPPEQAKRIAMASR